jgi:hypothetical protein
LTTSFRIGTSFRVQNDSSGTLSILAENSTVDLKSTSSSPWTLNEDEYAVVSKVGSNAWALILFKRPNLSEQTTVPVFTEYSTVGNITTGEDILFTDTIAANTFNTDGNVIRGRFSGIIALNGNDKTVRLKFGGTTIATRLAFDSPTFGQGWTLDYEVIRTSATTQKTNATFAFDGISSAYYAAASETMANDIVIQLTGESTSTDDIIKHTASGNFNPGAGSGSTPPPIEPPVIPFFAADNAVHGGDGYEHTYTGTWNENLSLPGWYADTETYSGTTNDSVTMRFNGTSIEWYNETAAHLGIAGVSIDGGAETNVDLYAATATQQVKVYTSPTLSQAEHEIKIRVTGTKNGSSAGNYITHDYFKVFNPEDVDPEGPPPTDPANLFVATAANGGVNTGDCSPGPCLTLAYAVTQAISGDLIQIGPGTFTETSYVSVPLGVSIRGSGIDVTTLVGASGLWDDWDDYGWEFDKSLLQYFSGSEQNGNQSLKDLTINGTGTAYNDGACTGTGGSNPCHPSALYDRGMYNGVWVYNRNNVTIDGIKVRKCFVGGVYVQNTENAKVLNSVFIDNGYGQTQFATGNIMWGGDVGNTGLEIVGNDINEGWGNGLKAFGPPPAGTNTVGMVTFDIHGNYVTVVPTGQWSGGSAPNIGFENWGVKMIDCELYDNYFDATISLVDNNQDDDAVNTIRVYNNTVDLLARSGGQGYAIELSVSYAEIDHNYLVGGRFSTIANYQGLSYPTLSSWYGYWNIHHNSVYAPVAVYPSPFLRSDEGIHETNIYNNTIEVPYTGTGSSVFNLIGVMAASQTSANINIKNNVVWGTLPAGSNNVWWPSSGGTVTNCVVSYNQFYQFNQNSLSGVTYSNNGTTNPEMNKTGVKPSPYYIPTNGGNLNDTGTNVSLPYLGAAPDKGAFELD